MKRLCRRLGGVVSRVASTGESTQHGPNNFFPRIHLRKMLVPAIVSAIAVVVACSDEMPTQRFAGPPQQGRVTPRKTVYPFVPGPVPGKFTVTMGQGDWAGRDTIVWPDTFVKKTRVRMTVTGKLTRAYHSEIPGDWSNIAGTPYGNIDANGDYSLINFQCAGGVFASFYHIYDGASNVDGCAKVSTNTYGSAELDSFSTVGLLRGTGMVFRQAGSQPVVPAPPYCSSTGSPRPCVVVTGGSQTITIERINTWINLTATPDSVSEGDSVLFTVFTDPANGLALQTP